jgi:acyl homoserine lactone synthase/acyl-homoserine lactone synthase
MFEARKRVFIDLLKWDLPVLAGKYELDQFDNPDATYLVLTDEDAGHLASTRLLRTDRPHILGELFPDLCAQEAPSGPTVREITRFCLEPTLRAPERRRMRNQLVSVLVEHALEVGVTDYTGVACVSWFEQIARFGWDCRALGSARRTCGQDLIALHIRIDPTTPAALAASGIYSLPTSRLTAAGGLQ